LRSKKAAAELFFFKLHLTSTSLGHDLAKDHSDQSFPYDKPSPDNDRIAIAIYHPFQAIALLIEFPRIWYLARLEK